MKHQVTLQLDAHNTTDMIKCLYGQIDILKSEIYFL